MQIIFSDNKSQDIVENEAMNQIKSIHGIHPSISTILKYSASEMRDMVEKERKGEKRFDWDTLTYKDENGDLIDLVCDRIETIDEETKNEISEKIAQKLVENVSKYYSREFEEKVQDAKDYYDEYGNFNYVETIDNDIRDARKG